MQSEYYWRADSCRVQLLVQEGESPYPGVSYVMQINLTGYNMVIREHINQRMRQWIPNPRHFSRGPIGVALRILSSSAPLAQTSHWTTNVMLLTDLSIMPIGQQRHESPLDTQIEVTATFSSVTVRYTLIQPMPSEHDSFSPGRCRQGAVSRRYG
jgi:hypothetical protein